MSKPREPRERVARRVRLFRKRQREALMVSNSFIFELKKYFRDRGLTNEWVSAADVHSHTIVLGSFLTLDKFIESIKGSKFDETIKPVRHIETSVLWREDGEVLLI